MQHQVKSREIRRAALLVVVPILALLCVATSSALAQQADPAPKEGWADDAAAKALSVTRPVVVNAEDVAMLRRLLGVPTPPAETSAMPVAASDSATSVSTDVAPSADSALSSDGSATATVTIVSVADGNLW